MGNILYFISHIRSNPYFMFCSYFLISIKCWLFTNWFDSALEMNKLVRLIDAKAPHFMRINNYFRHSYTLMSGNAKVIHRTSKLIFVQAWDSIINMCCDCANAGFGANQTQSNARLECVDFRSRAKKNNDSRKPTSIWNKQKLSHTYIRARMLPNNSRAKSIFIQYYKWYFL